METISEIINLKIKPKEKQQLLVEAVLSEKVPVDLFIAFFESASDVDKGTLADVMKHISAIKPELLAPFIGILKKYINHKAPRVKWGVPETIGNLAKKYPDETAHTIPYLLDNTSDKPTNTTVIKWCAAFALTEIAKYNQATRKELIPVFKKIISEEENSGVKNVYIKTLKVITKE